ncbi:MAG: DUF2157 domain-containing protein [Burkholderiaceae bacterium]|nr:DUF2157 domain-containing protein [Rhodoferax sp.]MCP5262144.1 DUF2157 domain-containing protein [Rhodoferax sp.]MCW5644627.1 DUF2157 domain-containing protein [Rhodoferax sp.]
MSDRHDILAWSAAGAVTDARAALRVAGVTPDARAWRHFLDRLLLWSGALSLAAAVVFFVAYNWTDLGRIARFAIVDVLVLVAVLGYGRLGADTAAGKACLLVASILLGALLALFGQTYQTGADTWELFANWAALMAPWVLMGRFAGLWMLWTAVANVAIVLYFQVFPGLFGVLFGTERVLWLLFGFNTLALLTWEIAATRLDWLRERWAACLLATASGITVTMLAVHAIFDWRASSGLALPAYGIWLAAVYRQYRVRQRDLFVLSGACLSIIVVIASLLGNNLVRGRGAALGYLMTAAAVIVLGVVLGRWLQQLAREDTTP